MYWADSLASKIIKSGKFKPYWVDDMKTPSGRVHIGSVRAVITHELIYRALKDRGVAATFTYVLEDHDPMDSIPTYLDQEKYQEHLGKPLFRIPAPKPGFKSYGHMWGEEYKQIFEKIGAHPQVIWGSELYLSGKMNAMVKLCLDKADVIRGIYKTLYKQDKANNWYPFNVACEKCGKLSTTSVTDWDGELVTYACKDLEWTKGCGHQGKVSPLNGNGKLPWKVEWACKWKVIGITVEGAGKDHMTAGGSHDFAKLVCAKVIDYPVPFAFSHEFFLVGGHKMSSSKGVGSSALEVSEILPPFLIRFMIARVKFNRAINFDPGGMTVPDLFDAYDEAALAYWSKGDKKLARIYEFSQVSGKPPQKHFLPRFRDVAQFIQHPEIDNYTKFAEIKDSELTTFEKDVLEDRIKYAQIWLDGYAPPEAVFTPTKSIPQETADLSLEQKQYLQKVVILLNQDWKEPEDLQQALYDKAKELNLSPKKAFAALYLSLIGKDHGPRAAWFLLEHQPKAIKRFKELTK
ncbi:MAG: lysine--tRNA ligase [Candidatus Chisholmbacteria bacterium]|nr:lysine--tRNA ligase [Candidatus Chisholmbacteria bacterium]